MVPDLAAFVKAMANGFAISALVGKRALMERGGLHHDQERVFLLSTTHGAETHALAAVIATMKIYEGGGVVEVLHRQGARPLAAASLPEALEDGTRPLRHRSPNPVH